MLNQMLEFRLEQESKIFFNWNYFEEIVINGEWKRVEKYLSAFTNLKDNRYSAKIFFLIRRQKYLEALDSNDHERAVNILWDDLAVFSALQENIYVELAELIALKNFRQEKFLCEFQ
ncbi:hypothetical protein L1049_013387 [Liquidambar formosana]|uniref:CTLH domain-containing protein n=1 Tax=Liquidambar formosana TaxID=63359 RepID=A0AAP0RNS8_LIQFO